MDGAVEGAVTAAVEPVAHGVAAAGRERAGAGQGGDRADAALVGQYPPVLNRVRRYARDVGNPRQLKSAGTPGANASILRHTGRKSGKQYQTPVTATRTVDGFVIGLPYGPNTDWLKNVLANGSTTLVYQGSSYRCDEPQVIPTAEAAADFSAGERRVLRLMGVDGCLRLHQVGADEAL